MNIQESAFPLVEPVNSGDTVHPGMTLRDWFAGQALNGLLSNPKLADEIKKNGGAFGGWIEDSAYGWANQMLKVKKALEEENTA